MDFLHHADANPLRTWNGHVGEALESEHPPNCVNKRTMTHGLE